jgi:pimeloyl-ACP methyl ester carboxylesterase
VLKYLSSAKVKAMRKNLLLATVPLMLFACGEQAAPKVEAPPLPSETPLERGKLLESVAVAGTNGESYAAYVPSSGESLPLLLLFDSHARGAGTLEKYQELAEQEKVIVVVSNTSKNGLDANTALAIGKRMMDAALARTPANRQVVWAGGFSGGARVASQFALAHQEVNGVIGIGAGYDPGAAQGRDLDFFGIVGLKDFNFREMLTVDSLREAQGQQGFLLLTEGGHEWPASEVMHQALDWQRLESLRDGHLSKEAFGSDKPFSKWVEWQQDHPSSSLLAKSNTLRFLISTYEHKSDAIPLLRQELASLEGSTPFVQAQDSRRNAIAFEVEQVARFEKKWNGLGGGLTLEEVTSLKRNAREESELGYAHQRFLNYLSLVYYTQASSALKEGALQAANHFLTMYATVDPPNCEHAYLRAHYWMKNGQEENALAALEQAVSLGFEDSDRLAADPVLKGLQPQPRFQAILQSIKK